MLSSMKTNYIVDPQTIITFFFFYTMVSLGRKQYNDDRDLIIFYLALISSKNDSVHEIIVKFRGARASMNSSNPSHASWWVIKTLVIF